MIQMLLEQLVVVLEETFYQPLLSEGMLQMTVQLGRLRPGRYFADTIPNVCACVSYKQSWFD